jgi:ComF family protein
MRGVLAWAFDLVFPARCPLCLHRTDRVALCADCDRAIALAGSPLCPVCGLCFAAPGADHRCGRCLRRPPHFSRARACALYRADQASPLIDALHRFKYGRDITLAGPLGEFLASHAPLAIDQDLVVAVPLHLERLRWRGFNQSLALAGAVAQAAGRPLIRTALEKQHATPPQVGLGEVERRHNVKGAFTMRRPGAVRGRSVLLIDDVMTTGATVDECARTLRRAGARRVDVLVLARAADNA